MVLFLWSRLSLRLGILIPVAVEQNLRELISRSVPALPIHDGLNVIHREGRVLLAGKPQCIVSELKLFATAVGQSAIHNNRGGLRDVSHTIDETRHAFGPFVSAFQRQHVNIE